MPRAAKSCDSGGVDSSKEREEVRRWRAGRVWRGAKEDLEARRRMGEGGAAGKVAVGFSAEAEWEDWVREAISVLRRPVRVVRVLVCSR